jgi:hypothetical protein
VGGGVGGGGGKLIFSLFNLLFLLYIPNLFIIQLAFLHFLLPHLHNSFNDIPKINKF